jgi:hypothetical protein
VQPAERHKGALGLPVLSFDDLMEEAEKPGYLFSLQVLRLF